MSDSKPRYFVPAAGEGGMTELHDAACRGDFDAVVAALLARPDVNAGDHGGWTPAAPAGFMRGHGTIGRRRGRSRPARRTGLRGADARRKMSTGATRAAPLCIF